MTVSFYAGFQRGKVLNTGDCTYIFDTSIRRPQAPGIQRSKNERKPAMNDPEARRRELLRQTRKRYDDNHFIPAVHPRYGNIYHELYDGQESAYPRDTFLFRLTLGILCFICYVWMDSSQAEIASVSSDQIVNQIEKQVEMEDIREVWNNL